MFAYPDLPWKVAAIYWTERIDKSRVTGRGQSRQSPSKLDPGPLCTAYGSLSRLSLYEVVDT